MAFAFTLHDMWEAAVSVSLLSNIEKEVSSKFQVMKNDQVKKGECLEQRAAVD